MKLIIPDSPKCVKLMMEFVEKGHVLRKPHEVGNGLRIYEVTFQGEPFTEEMMSTLKANGCGPADIKR